MVSCVLWQTCSIVKGKSASSVRLFVIDIFQMCFRRCDVLQFVFSLRKVTVEETAAAAVDDDEKL